MIVHTDGATMTVEGTPEECAKFWNAITAEEVLSQTNQQPIVINVNGSVDIEKLSKEVAQEFVDSVKRRGKLHLNDYAL